MAKTSNITQRSSDKLHAAEMMGKDALIIHRFKIHEKEKIINIKTDISKTSIFKSSKVDISNKSSYVSGISPGSR